MVRGTGAAPNGANLTAYTQAVEDGVVDANERTVLFNCATGLKHPMPPAASWFDRDTDADLRSL